MDERAAMLVAKAVLCNGFVMSLCAVAFVLFEIDGYSGEEVARFQDVPVNTVWARIQRARTRLAADITRLRWRG